MITIPVHSLCDDDDKSDWRISSSAYMYVTVCNSAAWVQLSAIWHDSAMFHVYWRVITISLVQESPANADKPARREIMPKIDPIRRENKLQTS